MLQSQAFKGRVKKVEFSTWWGGHWRHFPLLFFNFFQSIAHLGFTDYRHILSWQNYVTTNIACVTAYEIFNGNKTLFSKSDQKLSSFRKKNYLIFPLLGGLDPKRNNFLTLLLCNAWIKYFPYDNLRYLSFLMSVC